jgi:hypothetical protein
MALAQQEKDSFGAPIVLLADKSKEEMDEVVSLRTKGNGHMV